MSNYFREQSQETFFFWSQKFWTTGLQRWKKGVALQKDLFEIFEILEQPFLFKHFQKSECNGISSPTGWRVWSYKFIKRELPYILFFWIIFKIFGAAISKHPHENIYHGV